MQLNSASAKDKKHKQSIGPLEKKWLTIWLKQPSIILYLASTNIAHYVAMLQSFVNGLNNNKVNSDGNIMLEQNKHFILQYPQSNVPSESKLVIDLSMKIFEVWKEKDI